MQHRTTNYQIHVSERRRKIKNWMRLKIISRISFKDFDPILNKYSPYSWFLCIHANNAQRTSITHLIPIFNCASDRWMEHTIIIECTTHVYPIPKYTFIKWKSMTMKAFKKYSFYLNWNRNETKFIHSIEIRKEK